jgi:hypothetical protein
MHETGEYVDDTYGLRKLNERGLLFLHEVPNVARLGWILSTSLPDFDDPASEFQSVFDQHLALILS